MGGSASTQSTSSKSPSGSDGKGNKNGADDKKDKYPAGKVSIYFGSQTGTAEGFARTLMEEGQAAGFNCKVIDLEDFDVETLKTTDRAIFLMATYGEGEPTDNAVKFTKWMKNEDNSIPKDFLSKLKFAVFGLGNKQYEHFNLMGKTTNTCMEALGATRMFEYGEGDDDATLEEDFDAWRAKLWPHLTNLFHPDAAGAEASTRGRLGSNDMSHRIKLQFNCVPAPPVIHGSPRQNTNFAKVAASAKHFFTAPRAEIVVSRELRNKGSSKNGKKQSDVEQGSTLHVEIDLKSVNLQYQTADNLAILPENTKDNVESLAKSQGYDLDFTFNVEPVSNGDDDDEFKQTFPTPCTVRDVLTQHIDIQGQLKSSILKHLAAYVSDAKQLGWLMDLLHKDNKAALKKVVEEDCRTLVDLLSSELSSCKIPLADLLHIVPHIQPRYYTISSSSSLHPDTVHVTISITERNLGNGKQFVGLNSGYLKKLPVGTRCRVFVRASSFRLPKDLSTPILMIGPGTGLAPMRALLQERKFQQQQQKASNMKNILFFGCKNRDVDYIYRDELEAYEKEGVLSKLYTAFSRDSDKKVYVQNLMADPVIAVELLDLLLKQGTYIYVCGATAMGNDVHSTLINVLETHNNMTTQQATAFVKDLQDKGRYVQELWSA